jgi:hypothetical protein
MSDGSVRVVESSSFSFLRAKRRFPLKAGAVGITAPAHHFFGDKIGRVRDPAGNIWWIQTHLEDVEPEEMGRRMSGLNRFTEAMQEAQASLHRELSSRK